MSPDTYNGRLNAVNIVVSLITVLITAIDWVLKNHQNNFWRAYVIVSQFQNVCLAVSCAILVWGFQRLIKIVQSADHLVNKAMIGWHIVTYFLIMMAKIVVNFTLHSLF